MATKKVTENIEEIKEEVAPKKTTKKKTTTTKKKATTKKSIEEVMEEKELELSRDFEDERLAERRKAREKRKLFTDDLDILMFCNCGNSEFIYECPKTEEFFVLQYGDTEFFTFEQLKAMKNSHRAVLESFTLIPVDVESDELTLEDVLKELRIEDFYSEEMLYEDNIDYVLEKMNVESFKRYMDSLYSGKNRLYANRVLDRAIELTAKKRFNDMSKMTYLENLFGKEDLFSSILSK